MSTPNQNVVDDVRCAKTWVDQKFVSFDQLATQLRSLEEDFRNRTGQFATVPTKRPQWVQDLIDQAPIEPGGDLLGELRSTKH